MIWDEERIAHYFWRHVTKTENDACWWWSGDLNNMGYGVVRWWENGKGRRYLAHRFVLAEIEQQNIAGFVVMHNCDTPNCVRPDHLKIGTQWAGEPLP
jgi:hypothetical protein